MKKRFLIIGANSDIAKACIPLFEEKGVSLILAARNPDLLSEFKHEVISMDVLKPDDSLATIKSLNFDGIVYAPGILPPNEPTLFEEEAEETIAVNYASAIKIIGLAAKKLSEKGSGTIVGISSVAAIRGKSSNVLYSSTKAGFDSYLSGLRQYFQGKGIRVLTIRPGFVATKMTAGMNLPKSLTATPEQVAQKIVQNALSGDRNIVYVKAIWRPLSFIIKMIPEPIFKRRKL